MSQFESLFDIYALKNSFHSIIEGSNCCSDFNNVIQVHFSHKNMQNFPCNTSGEFVCEKCHSPTLFLHDSPIGYACPKCIYTCFENGRNCQLCHKKQGCDSCGGIVNNMVNIDGVTLCAQDRCLMPFGYYIPNDQLICSCEHDISHILKEKLPHVLCDFIAGMTIDHSIAWPYLFSHEDVLLGNLSKVNKQRCMPCQIENKFTLPKREEFVSGFSEICSCYT